MSECSSMPQLTAFEGLCFNICSASSYEGLFVGTSIYFRVQGLLVQIDFKAAAINRIFIARRETFLYSHVLRGVCLLEAMKHEGLQKNPIGGPKIKRRATSQLINWHTALRAPSRAHTEQAAPIFEPLYIYIFIYKKELRISLSQ